MPDEDASSSTTAATAGDDLLSETEAAALLGATPRALEDLRREGTIEAVSERSGWRRAWRYRRAAVEAYLETQREAVADTTPRDWLKEILQEMPPPPVAHGGDGEDYAASPPPVRLAYAILANAIDLGASHIFVEPDRRGVLIRFRVSGVLHEAMPLPRHVHPHLLNRFKVMADLPAEASAPQTGTIPIKHNGADYRLRVDTVPSRYGEAIAVGIQAESVRTALHNLGMAPWIQEPFEETIARPSGLTLLAGRAGHGTTTSLYTTLHKINSIQSRIVVLTDAGDPAASGITQVPPADAGKGQTEAERVRGALAQRPDVLVFSEIRDAETMRLALDAAEDGVRVIGAMRAPFGAVSAVERVLDWGIAPARLARILNGVLAQRLVRRLCLECRNSYTTTPADAGVDRLARRFPSVDPEAEAVTLYLAQGCDKCLDTGYRGRVGTFEMLRADDSVRDFLVGSRRRAETLEDAAVHDGLIPLHDYGTLLLLNGTTSMEELIRAGLRPPR